MLKSSLLASGAAAIAFALAAAPALAQSSGHGSYDRDTGAYEAGESGPQHSTPAEHAQTEGLNRAGQHGSYAAPAVLNGQKPGGLDRAAAQSQVRAKAHDARVDAYRDRVQHYDAQEARYQDQRALYERNMRRYARGKWRFENYPARIVYRYRGGGLRDVATMHDVVRRLNRAPVHGPDGWVGKVRTGYAGGPRQVEIALNRQFAVWVGADRLRFDPARAVVFTDLSEHALWSMPGVYIHTVDYR